MGTIVLKTAKRNTRVSRFKVRQAIAAVYGAGASFGKSTSPSRRVVKKAAKKAATCK